MPAASEKRSRDAGAFRSEFTGLVAANLPAPAKGKPVEVWFMDEARVGQQGTLTRVWARLAKGSARWGRMEWQGEEPRGTLDQAGWHASPKLRVPENITLLPLPPYAPELNPAEQVWAYLRTTSSATASGTATRTSWMPAAMLGTN